jgi:HK97 family phage prohead protease
MIEHKFVELKELKMSDSGPGTIEGYRAVFDIDEGADLIIPGAFKDTTEEYLKSGFTAHSHQWAFSEAVGFPLTAREDSTGWFVKSQFHTTQNAQDVRTVAKERMKAGKTVGFSFGYTPTDFAFIQARDYESELPKYVTSDRLAYNMAQAKRFPQIRLLKKVSVIEDSIVTAPMNKLAAATSVKHGGHRRLSVSATETLRLRGQSLALQARTIETLYGPFPEPKSAIQLRYESLRLRSRVLRTLYG